MENEKNDKDLDLIQFPWEDPIFNVIPNDASRNHFPCGVFPDENIEPSIFMENNDFNMLDPSLPNLNSVASETSFEVLSPTSSCVTGSYTSDFLQSPRYVPNNEPVLSSLIDLATIKTEINTLASEYKSLCNTNLVQYKQRYNSTVEKLVNVDNTFNASYEKYTNERLTQRRNICVSDHEFINIKSHLNGILELALLLHSISFDEDTTKSVWNLIYKLLQRSFLVTQQSTQILQDSKTIDAHVALFCHPTIHINNVNPVIASLYSAHELKRKIAKKNEINEGRGDYHTVIVANHSVNKKETNEYTLSLAVDSAAGLIGNFEKIKMIHFSRTPKPTSIFEDKYALVFETTIKLPNLEAFNIFTYSKPIIVITNSCQENQAHESILWDTACASIHRDPFVTTKTLKWSSFKNSLNYMFREVLGRELSQNNLNFIFSKIMIHSNMHLIENMQQDDYEIDREIHWKHKIDYLKVDPPSTSNSSLNTSLVKFKSSVAGWVIETMDFVKDHFSYEWKNGLIYGFLEKPHAENLICNHEYGTFLMRFSETNLRTLSLVYVKMENNRYEMNHAAIVDAHLQGKSLHAIITSNDPKVQLHLKRILCADGKIVDKAAAYQDIPRNPPRFLKGYRPVELLPTVD